MDLYFYKITAYLKSLLWLLQMVISEKTSLIKVLVVYMYKIFLQLKDLKLV